MRGYFTSVLLVSMAATVLCGYAGAAGSTPAPASGSPQTSALATWDKALAAQLDNPISGSLDLLSNYVWRGVTQTQNSPALQGSLTYTFDSGFYLNVLGSNVNFTDQNGDNATVELDWMVGYSKQLDNGLSYGVFAQRYSYPKASGSDYNEYFLNLSYGILTAAASYSDSVFATGKSGNYYSLGADYEVPAKYILAIEGVAIGGGIGYSHLPVEAGPSYLDYNAYIAKSLGKKLKLSVTYTNTSHALVDGQHVTADLSLNFS